MRISLLSPTYKRQIHRGETRAAGILSSQLPYHRTCHHSATRETSGFDRVLYYRADNHRKIPKQPAPPRAERKSWSRSILGVVADSLPRSTAPLPAYSAPRPPSAAQTPPRKHPPAPAHTWAPPPCNHRRASARLCALGSYFVDAPLLSSNTS